MSNTLFPYLSLLLNNSEKFAPPLQLFTKKYIQYWKLIKFTTTITVHGVALKGVRRTVYIENKKLPENQIKTRFSKPSVNLLINF